MNSKEYSAIIAAVSFALVAVIGLVAIVWKVLHILKG